MGVYKTVMATTPHSKRRNKMNQFRITRKNIEGMDMFCVGRVDGKSFADGVVSYNFTLSRMIEAIQCMNKLNEKEG